MWKTHARHLPLLCPLRSCRALSPSPFSLLRPSSPCCPSLLLCSLAGIPPVQHKRYAKLFIRIAPQGELKGAGQARGVQQFKKICETVCVCVCVSVAVRARVWVRTRTRKNEPSRAEPGSAHVNLLWLLLLSKRKLELCHQCVSDSFYSWLIWIITERHVATRGGRGDERASNFKESSKV